MSILTAAHGMVIDQKWAQSGTGITYTEVRDGSRDNLYSYAASLQVNKTVLDGRKLVSKDLQHREGAFWRLTLQYLEADGTTQPDGTEYGKKTAKLSMRNISLPLETLVNYRANWNHYLISTTNVVPSWWESAEDTILTVARSKEYKWVKSGESLPAPTYSGGKAVEWRILEEPTKPGVESVDFAVYVITLTSKHSSASKAGSSVANKANVIVSSPPGGNMGVSGGDWKCCGAEVSFDGKFWVAVETYERSATDAGWDRDLYTGG